MNLFSKNRYKSVLSIILAFLCISVCFSGCSSYQTENQNLPEAEAFFPKTTWGMSVNDVKNVYKDLHDITKESDLEYIAYYQKDEIEHCGEKTQAIFTFLKKEDKTWLISVNLETIDPMTDKELLTYIEKDEIKEIEALSKKLTRSLTDLTEEEKVQLNKNQEYLGMHTDGKTVSFPLYTVSAGISEKEDGKHYSFEYSGRFFLLSNYDFQFSGCSSYQTENQNLPEAEAVFPKTTWGMSVNDVKNSYKDLYDVSDEPKYESENTATYRVDELDFYGMKMAATFSFYKKDGKTWLSGVSATSLDTATDVEIAELKVKSDLSALLEKLDEVNTDSSKASEEQQELLDKNREYLGLPIGENDRVPFYFLQVGGTTLNEKKELHCQVTFTGFGYLFTHYDLQTGESLSE